MNKSPWTPAENHPQLTIIDCFYRHQSEPVLGLDRFGDCRVVFAYKYYDEDEPKEINDAEELGWKSCCSDEWDLTDDIIGWMFLPVKRTL